MDRRGHLQKQLKGPKPSLESHPVLGEIALHSPPPSPPAPPSYISCRFPPRDACPLPRPGRNPFRRVAILSADGLVYVKLSTNRTTVPITGAIAQYPYGIVSHHQRLYTRTIRDYLTQDIIRREHKDSRRDCALISFSTDHIIHFCVMHFALLSFIFLA